MRWYAASWSRAPTSELPQLEQRRREQRQRPGLAFDVVDHRVLKVGVDAQSHAFGRLGDRATHLVARHRPDDHVVGPDEARQPRVRGAAGIEVGSKRQHDHRAPPRVLCELEQRGDEGVALCSSRQTVNASSN